MTETPTPEIIVGEIDKSARETIRIALSAYEGTPTVSIWRWCRDALWRSASRQGRPRGRPSPPPRACRSLGVGAGRPRGRMAAFPLNSPSEALGTRWTAFAPPRLSTNPETPSKSPHAEKA